MSQLADSMNFMALIIVIPWVIANVFFMLVSEMVCECTRHSDKF